MYVGIIAITVCFAGVNALWLVLAMGGALLIGIGTLDDWYKAKCREFPVAPKFIVQIFTATLAFAMGIRFRGLGLSWLGGTEDSLYLFPEWFSYLATVVWILGLINMVNFLDGADGLAGGVSTLSATTLFFIALVKGQELTALIAIVMVGATLAFLRFNFFPAQLFMGDAGATFLGFALAIVSLEGSIKGATLISLVVTVLALGLPVMDTLQVMISRLLAGTSITQADRRHVHHRLMSKGLTAKQTVMVLYVVSFLFSVVSLLIFLAVT